MKKSEQLQYEFHKRFDKKATFYYNPRYGWMWKYKEYAPQIIGNNFKQALLTVQTSYAMEYLLEKTNE